MANLTSPGIQVSVTDESVYGPAGAGTVPMIFIATGDTFTHSGCYFSSIHHTSTQFPSK